VSGPLRIVVNTSAGSATGDDLAATMREALPAAEVVEIPDGESPLDCLREVAPGAGVIGVAGGDGSVDAAVTVALEHDLPLLVVPAGTLNHFARAIGVETIEDAIAAATRGATVRVDVCEVNGRPFVNNASIGLYAAVVDHRERHERRLGKWLALVVAIVVVLRRARPLTVEVAGRRRTVWCVFFGNGRYDDDGFIAATRSRLDDGLIDVRIVNAKHRLARLRLVIATLAGRYRRSPVYEEWTEADVVSVDVLAGETRIAADGETFDGTRHIEVCKRARALRVLACQPVEP
jgi:undecaprenyl-diphosphatase